MSEGSDTPRSAGLPRLFSAVSLSDESVAALRRELDRHAAPVATAAERDVGVLRWSAVEQWHITLGFYGPDDLATRVEWLRHRLAGLRSPVVRLAGAGSFPGVLWLGVEGIGLVDVARVIRPDDQRPFVAHLTLARATTRRGRDRAAGQIERWRRALADFGGPEWTPPDVVLMRSDSTPAGTHYSVVERFPLDAPEQPWAPAVAPVG